MKLFNIGDSVVHLTHGVGIVKGIDYRLFKPDNEAQKFYIIEIEDNGALKKVFVPFESADKRLRAICSPTIVKEVYKILADKSLVINDSQTWNRRYREYMDRIHTGNAIDITNVYRSLLQLKNDKELSFGERKLLDQANTLLVKELSVAENLSEFEIEQKLFDLIV